MEPYKKQNKQLMSIIGAAEKGHNLLLNTMQSINSEIAGNFWINTNLLFIDYSVLSVYFSINVFIAASHRSNAIYPVLPNTIESIAY